MKNYDETMVKRGIFSDTTSEFIQPMEPKEGESVKIKIRVLKGSVREVSLVNGEETFAMKRACRKGMFDIYSKTITMGSDTYSYHFELMIGEDLYFYDAEGLKENREDLCDFRLIPGFHTPDWAKGAVFYQIFVDRFCNGDPSNDVVDAEYKYIDRLVYSSKWGEPVCKDGIGQFYGGDLKGVMDKLDYLKDLGVEVIYFNPLFVSPSNHKYDTADYDYIDPHYGKIVSDFGELLSERARGNSKASRFVNRIAGKDNLEASNALFAELVKAAHERGIKVILDGVFNHCGSFNKWLDAEKLYSKAPGYEKGAFVAENSPYHDFFKFEGGTWPNNKNYKSWWGYDTLPKLNYASEELYNYMLKVGAKWVSEPYNCDGWRLDVAADLGDDPEMNHRFWADFRKAVKEANPEAIILAEHYGDPSAWLGGNEWDTVMNYDAFMEPVTWFTTGMEKHSDEYRKDLKGNTGEFWRMMRENSAKFTTPSLQLAMNELSNHDHSRFLTRTTEKVERYNGSNGEEATQNASKAVMREAVTMQMTWPGAPTLYYGDEAGLGGFTDPDNRRCYPWGEEDKDLINFHKKLISIHKANEEFKKGSLIPFPTVDGVLAYGRKSGKNASIVVINNFEVNVEVAIPTWMLALGKKTVSRRIFSTFESGWNTKKKTFREEKGITKVEIGPKGAVILKTKKKIL